MKIGLIREIKDMEYRVGLTPDGVRRLTGDGHAVRVECSAGVGSGFADDDYAQAGAELVDAPVAWDSDLVVKVKEPQPVECGMLREGQTLFTYLHLAPDPEQTRLLIESGSTAIAYETVTDRHGGLPLLAPMSEVAGPMAIQEGAKYLEMAQGGHGVLLGGVPGVDPATVVILGGGVVGGNAAKMASGLGAKVYVLDIDLERLRYLSDVMPAQCVTLMSSPAAIRDVLPHADLVVGAVLVPGSKTPTLVTREMLGKMKQGSVMVDVSIDQGGCFETSRETTHDDPIYKLDGIVHYAVSNMPGVLPRTSTLALNNATLPYIAEIASKGWKKAMKQNPEIKLGANVVKGKVTYKGVADAFGLKFTPIESLLKR